MEICSASTLLLPFSQLPGRDPHALRCLVQLPPTSWGKSASFQKQTTQNPAGFELFVSISKAKAMKLH